MHVCAVVCSACWKTTCVIWSSPSTRWNLAIQLRSSGLAGSSFTHKSFHWTKQKLVLLWFQRLQSITGGQIWQSSSHHGDQIANKEKRKRAEQAIALKTHKWPSSFSQHKHARIPPPGSSSFIFFVYQWMKTFTEPSWFNQLWKCLQECSQMCFITWPGFSQSNKIDMKMSFN